MRYTLLAVLPLTTLPTLAQIPVQSIGTLPNHTSSAAAGLSADGSTVFGSSSSTTAGPGQIQPIIWTASRGLESLGFFGGTFSSANAASANGSVVVGGSGNAQNSYRAFRWTRKTGMQDLGILSGSHSSSAAVITPDGSVIAGTSISQSGTTAFRWTQPGGMQGIGAIAEPISITANGNTIACKGGTTGFLWTAATGLQPLPLLNNPSWYPYSRSWPVWVDPEGSDIIGNAVDTTGGDWPMAFQYSETGGYQGFLSGEQPWWFATVEVVSPTGDLIVGTNYFSPGQEQHVIVNGAPVPTLTYLVGRGADFTGWVQAEYQRPRITGISTDLRTFAGNGTRISGELEGWVVTLPAVCYVNCDSSTASPILTANDFQCFLNQFASGDPYANCDNSTGSPLLTANDFTCFLNAYTAGCP